jgi:hypothetical protein
MNFKKSLIRVKSIMALTVAVVILGVTGVVWEARASSDCNSSTNKDKYWDNDTCPSAKDHCCGKSNALVLF